MPTTVILGAGIIGLASAHSLSKLAPPDHSVHLVEPAPKLFSSASGKAAGFLAKDWFAPAVASLGALAFDLHRSLAELHNGSTRWGYSGSISYSLDHAYHLDPKAVDNTPAPALDASTGAKSQAIDEPSPQSSDQPASHSEGGLDWLLNGTSRASVVDADALQAFTSNQRDYPKWLRASPQGLEMISDKNSTAQVHPRKLCEFLLEQCLAAGVTLHHPARATTLLPKAKEPAGVAGIRVQYLGQPSDNPEGRERAVDIPCDNIVIAAGCWTPQVYATLFPNATPIPRISHLAGYSLTIKSEHWPFAPVHTNADALRVRDGARSSSEEQTSKSSVPAPTDSSPCHAIFTDAGGFAPEIFSRATGDVWIGGLNPPTTPLPPLPTDAQIDPREVERLLAVTRVLCEGGFELCGQALCFRPVSASGRPIIARVPEDGLKPAGVFVATGHGPWGISLSLGTGQVVAEMVLGRETSADVAALSSWL